MPKPEMKTQKTTASVIDFLNKTVTDSERRKDCETVIEIMRGVTGKEPMMWGSAIVGFDEYEYTRRDGSNHKMAAVGFSPRKAALTIYIMPGYADYGDMLKNLGPHKMGKGCLYIKRLKDVDIQVLKKLIKRGYEDLRKLSKNGLQY